jgi:phosphoribosyl 1,2-cyclic phosphodiesterase
MELKVIGSSSEGNAYVLQNTGEALLLEAGIGFKKVLPALDYDVSKVQGVLVTHEHGDHAGHLNDVLSYGLPVYASAGTIEGAKRYMNRTLYEPAVIEKHGDGYQRLQLGNFTVIPFPTQHDANEPLGFYIWHAETGGILFATDTFYLKNRFAGLSNILIECNYDQQQLEDNLIAGRIDAARYRRVRHSHLSYTTCLELLQANDLKAVNNIVLIHTSKDNGNAYRFREGIAKATRKTVSVAKPGLVLNFNKTPF